MTIRIDPSTIATEAPSSCGDAIYLEVGSFRACWLFDSSLLDDEDDELSDEEELLRLDISSPGPLPPALRSRCSCFFISL